MERIKDRFLIVSQSNIAVEIYYLVLIYYNNNDS